jgi:hemolysin activation/secretion protein
MRTVSTSNAVLGTLFFATSLVNVHARAAAPAQSGGAVIGTFDINGYQVDGNTLLKKTLLDRTLAAFTGPSQSFETIEAAVKALETAYRRHGYALVKVMLPEQELNDGVVHLQVIETHLGEVRVTGDAHHGTANILRSLPALRVSVTPDTDALSRELRSANENPSKKLDVDLSSAATPGIIDATVKVNDQPPWAVTATFDNSGLDASGRNHVTAQYQNFNLWGLDHVFSAQYTTATENPGKINIYGAGYHMPLYALGDSIDLYGTYSNIGAAMVSAGLLDLQVSGAGKAYGLHYNHSLPRLGSYDSQLVLGFDRKVFEESIQYSGVDLGSNVTVDPLSLSYVGQWLLPGNGVTLYLTVVRNVPGGSQGSDADFAAARSAAGSNYGLLRYGAGYTRALPADWQVRLSVNGQLTHDALVPGEQFGVGGATSVRGLEEREIADDKGVTVNLEAYTPNFCGRFTDLRCLALAFFDDGHVSRNDALPGEETHSFVDSAGVGFRLSGRHVSMQLDYGHVLSATDPAQKGEQRLHALLAVTF